MPTPSPVKIQLSHGGHKISSIDLKRDNTQLGNNTLRPQNAAPPTADYKHPKTPQKKELISQSNFWEAVHTVGNSYANAAAEAGNRLYKKELIWSKGPWRSTETVELVTLTWVDWYNTRRLQATATTYPQPPIKATTTLTTNPPRHSSARHNTPSTKLGATHPCIIRSTEQEDRTARQRSSAAQR